MLTWLRGAGPVRLGLLPPGAAERAAKPASACCVPPCLRGGAEGLPGPGGKAAGWTGW